jgi:hypothetical protein
MNIVAGIATTGIAPSLFDLLITRRARHVRHGKGYHQANRARLHKMWRGTSVHDQHA